MKPVVFSTVRIPQSNRPVREFRIISKRGRLHVYLDKIPEKYLRYVIDLWNTLVNMRWRWLLLFVSLVNVAAYLCFALFFLLDAWLSGDFEGKIDHKKCVVGMHNFTSFFMLGIETITTTGYGYFHPTEECYLVFIILTWSHMVTIFIDGAFISVVYAKINRPNYRVSKTIFSKRAVISLRNGKLCLIFRINDRTGKHHIRPEINLYLIGQSMENNEIIPNYVSELRLQPYGMLFWPTDVVHVIDEESALWNISAADMMTNKFEVVATVTGTSVHIGQTSRSQTSYLHKEIMWGHSFLPCLEYDISKQRYVVNEKFIFKTVQQNVPLCSANVLDALQKDVRKKLSVTSKLSGRSSRNEDQQVS